MKSPRNISHWVVLATAVFLAACASVNLNKVQREPEFSVSKIRKVMVLSLSNDFELRRAVEDEFVRLWRKRSVNAIAGYTVIPPTTPLTKLSVSPIAREQGFDTALVTRLLGRSKIDPNIRGETFDVSDSTGDAQELAQYFQAQVASPQYSGDYTIAVVKSDLYDVQTENRVWSGTSQVLVAGDIPSRIKQYVKIIIEYLYK